MASKSDISTAYAKADKAIEEQYKAAKKAVATAPNSIPEDYKAMNDAVTDRRSLYAIGNVGDGARDAGYTNTNRLRSEAALGEDITANIKQQARADAERDLNNQLLGYQADIAANEYRASSALNKANALENEAQYTAERELAKRDAAEQQRQFDASMETARQEAVTAQAQYAAEMEYSKAINELQLYGKVMTESAAAVLGVPVGTTSLEWEEYLAKLEEASRKGSGSGRNGKENPYDNTEYIGGRGVVPGMYAENTPTVDVPMSQGVVPGAAGTEMYTNAGMSMTDAILAAYNYSKNNNMGVTPSGSQGVVPGALATDRKYRKNVKK